MALVLTGFSSYTVSYKTQTGIDRRVTISKGEDASALNLPEEIVNQLRAIKVRLAANKLVPAFIEIDVAPQNPAMHSSGGKISNETMKKPRARRTPTAEVVEPVAVEPVAEVVEPVAEVVEPVAEVVEPVAVEPVAEVVEPVAVEPVAPRKSAAKKKSSSSKKKSTAKKSTKSKK